MAVNKRVRSMNQVSGIVKAVFIIFPLIFLIIGAIVCIATYIKSIDDAEFMKTAESCDAQIDYINVYTTRSSSGTGRHRHTRTVKHYDAYVHYTVDEYTYTNIKIPVNSSAREGDIITIYYNPTNPSEFMTEPSASNYAGGYISGGIIALGGTVFLLIVVINSRRNQKPAPVTSYSYNNRENQYIHNNEYLTGSNSNSNLVNSQNDYNDPLSTYTGYNPNDTYNGYENHQQSEFSDYSDNNYQNNEQNSPFNTYSDNSYQNNEQNSTFNTYSDNSYQNNEQNSPFNTYSDNSYQNNEQNSTFNTYSDNSYQNNEQSSPFNTYSNSRSDYDYNSTITSNSYSEATYSDFDNTAKKKSPFDKYKD